jgi:catechol 2,3-dioxygenase-like lactoylglutathione lyase family enzyme
VPGGFESSSLSRLPQASEVGFTTDDVASALEKARQARAVIVAEPKQKPWGQTVAYVRDPDGHLIEICTPIG